MKEEIKVPPMGESIVEATVGVILKPSGSVVVQDDELLELETEKVNQVLFAPAKGTVTFTVATGDTVKIGQVIGAVDSDGQATASSPAAPQPAADESTVAPTPQPEQEKAKAKEADKTVRISKEDYLKEVTAGATASTTASASTPTLPSTPPSVPSSQPPLPPPPSEASTSRVRMPRIRQVIARRLLEATQTTAMLTTFNEVDMSAVMALRASYKDDFNKEHGVKLGFMSFFVKAIVSALKLIPAFNSYIDGEDIVTRHYYDIGIAVGTDRGLVVPVVRGCDTLSLAAIEQAIERYAKSAREGRLSVDDLTGGCFTITNGGVYGSLLSTPILNPPQCGILGMHAIQKRGVVVGDQIVIRPMMYLALSYDHRVVDGKEAVTFLVHVKKTIEEPSRLLLEL